MALDNSQILSSSFEAAKTLLTRGNLTTDEKTILGSFPQQIFDHKEFPVRRHFEDDNKFRLVSSEGALIAIMP